METRDDGDEELVFTFATARMETEAWRNKADGQYSFKGNGNGLPAHEELALHLFVQQTLEAFLNTKLNTTQK